MIPLSVDIKNFLSYGDQLQSIDFGPHALICLSGKNGNGKSALLDALTWAVWGQARKVPGVSKADDGLLRLGAKRMMVALTFIFNGKKYRVRREYERSYGKPLASLDFEYYHEEQNRFFSLTDKTIRATQEKIELLLGIDFETFSNSAFLRQGQSNEFSKKMPRERKQILATILGLDRYDQLQQEALSLAKKLIDTQKLQEHDCARYQQELTEEERLLNEQLCLQKTVKEKEAEESLLRKDHEELQALIAQTTEQQIARQHAAQEMSRIKLSELEHRKQFFDLAARWRNEYHAFLQEPDYSSLRAEREELLLIERSLAEKQQEYLRKQTTLAQLHKEYELHKERIIQQYAQKKELLRLSFDQLKQQANFITSELEKKKEKGKKNNEEQKILFEQMAYSKLIITAYEEKKVIFDQEQKQFEKRKSFYQNYSQQGKFLNEELGRLEQKRHIMLQEEAPACPLCDSLLTQKRKKVLIQSIEQQMMLYKKKLQRLAQLVTRLKQLCIEQHQQIEKNKSIQLEAIRQQEQLKLLQEKALLTAQEQEKIKAEENELSLRLISIEQELTEKKNDQEKILFHEQEAFSHNVTLKTLEEQIEKIRVELAEGQLQEKKHLMAQKELKRLEALLQKEQELSQRKIIHAHLKQSLHEVRILLKKERELYAYYHIQAAQLTVITEKLNEQKKQALLLVAQLKKNTEEKETLRTALHVIIHTLEQLGHTKERFIQLQKEINLRAHEIVDYQELALAFSKNGIQALLIEEAIPEIEQEANQLLARLTDNQSQIFIESLRDLKSGKVKETLDIHISDTVGIRPYEMFSGGEAFRIDFALRIALSKLLARRAGTALQTLIIDEGFGSQDEEGLRLIMQALYAIQDDFAKIIIVSHLPEFKENFPVHFIIEKTSSGSIVRIEERG